MHSLGLLTAGFLVASTLALPLHTDDGALSLGARRVTLTTPPPGPKEPSTTRGWIRLGTRRAFDDPEEKTGGTIDDLAHKSSDSSQVTETGPGSLQRRSDLPEQGHSQKRALVTRMWPEFFYDGEEDDEDCLIEKRFHEITADDLDRIRSTQKRSDPSDQVHPRTDALVPREYPAYLWDGVRGSSETDTNSSLNKRCHRTATDSLGRTQCAWLYWGSSSQWKEAPEEDGAAKDGLSARSQAQALQYGGEEIVFRDS